MTTILTDRPKNREVLRIHPQDNVLVALQDLPSGWSWEEGGVSVKLLEPVAAKHKFLTEDLRAGEEVFMYGVLVGKVQYDLPKGTLLTTENLHHAASDFQARDSHFQWQAPDVTRWQHATFQGYHRRDGQVGTANYWLVIPLVFCENRNVNILRMAFEKALGYDRPDPYTLMVRSLATQYKSGQPRPDRLSLQHFSETLSPSHRLFPNVDGLRFLTHTGGCGGTRKDARDLAGLLAGYLHHPNVAGATVLSLGCQNTQISLLQEEIRSRDADFDKPLLIFEQQAYGSETALMEAAILQTFEGLIEVNKLKRSPAPLSKLSIGVECGGSDGFSGISANPAMGQAADLLVALQGTVILSEFPELCGVEQELINRCENPAIAERFVEIMRRYQGWAEAVGSGFDMNPSPGNIRDGLITDAIKSAGAAKKGGTSPIVDVLDYPEYAHKPGLNLLCTPGNDVESTTGLAGAGANIILFSTGLGTPTGNPISPVLKVSSNRILAQRMPDIIDFDAGDIIEGTRSLAQAGDDLLDLIIRTASGEYLPCAEKLGQHDFIPWKRGVSL